MVSWNFRKNKESAFIQEQAQRRWRANETPPRSGILVQWFPSGSHALAGLP
jgi:hypothetical protein